MGLLNTWVQLATVIKKKLLIQLANSSLDSICSQLFSSTRPGYVKMRFKYADSKSQRKVLLQGVTLQQTLYNKPWWSSCKGHYGTSSKKCVSQSFRASASVCVCRTEPVCGLTARLCVSGHHKFVSVPVWGNAGKRCRLLGVSDFAQLVDDSNSSA